VITQRMRQSLLMGKDPGKCRDLILDPFMIHEAFPSLTETASGSHPCCVGSVTYDRTFFHGGNTGSNPVGDANFFNNLHALRFNVRLLPSGRSRAWPRQECHRSVGAGTSSRGWSAISLLALPAAINLNTLTSAGVRASSVECSAIWYEASGERVFFPAWTARNSR
jgi:hypothetical protein